MFIISLPKIAFSKAHTHTHNFPQFPCPPPYCNLKHLPTTFLLIIHPKCVCVCVCMFTIL